MICDRCNKEPKNGGVYLGNNPRGYRFLCYECRKIVCDEEELKTVKQLETMEQVRKLSPRLLVRNFVKYLCEYQKNPTKEYYDILWRIRCWAAHEDRTVSCAINEICKLLHFDFYIEECKLKGEQYD